MWILPKVIFPFGEFKSQFRCDMIPLVFLVKKVGNGRSAEVVVPSKQIESELGIAKRQNLLCGFEDTYSCDR